MKKVIEVVRQLDVGQLDLDVLIVGSQDARIDRLRHDRRPHAELSLVLSRYSEKFADDGNRQGVGDTLDDVDNTIVHRCLDGHGVEHRVGEGDHSLAQLINAARGKSVHHQPPQTGVIRRIEEDQLRITIHHELQPLNGYGLPAEQCAQTFVAAGGWCTNDVPTIRMPEDQPHVYSGLDDR